MTTDTIYETDDAEEQFPYDAVDEMDAIEHGLTVAFCCGSIPCRFGACEVN